MDYLVFILVLIIFGLGMYVWRLRNDNFVRHGKSSEKMPELVQKQKKEKEEHKQKILEMFDSRDKIANKDVESGLDVSDATATRYLDEMEKEGKIKQVGTDGQNVYYKKV